MAIKKHIPNTITCCNLVSGCVAIAYAFSGKIELSFTWIIIGAVFDFFDGMSARLLKVSSPIGKELDSLADIVTFGVAPSTILFSKLSVMPYPDLLEPLRSILPFTAYIMAAFSALRLAKFNLDERQALGFIGLPTPANALFWGSLIIGAGNKMDSSPIMCLFIIAGIFLSSWLMVSEISMFALKFKEWSWKNNQVKYIFLLTCIPLVAIFGIIGFAIIIAWYVVVSYLIKK